MFYRFIVVSLIIVASLSCSQKKSSVGRLGPNRNGNNPSTATGFSLKLRKPNRSCLDLSDLKSILTDEKNNIYVAVSNFGVLDINGLKLSETADETLRKYHFNQKNTVPLVSTSLDDLRDSKQDPVTDPLFSLLDVEAQENCEKVKFRGNFVKIVADKSGQQITFSPEEKTELVYQVPQDGFLRVTVKTKTNECAINNDSYFVAQRFVFQPAEATYVPMVADYFGFLLKSLSVKNIKFDSNGPEVKVNFQGYDYLLRALSKVTRQDPLPCSKIDVPKFKEVEQPKTNDGKSSANPKTG